MNGFSGGHVGGAFTSSGSILVLFILLVIVICGCFR
nr:YjcZ family sporulation protein [Paenibacillus sp. OV219]